MEIIISYFFMVLAFVYLFWVAYRMDAESLKTHAIRLNQWQKKVYFYQDKPHSNQIDKASFWIQSFLYVFLILFTIILFVLIGMMIAGTRNANFEFLFAVGMFGICGITTIIALSDMIWEFIKEIIHDIQNRE